MQLLKQESLAHASQRQGCRWLRVRLAATDSVEPCRQSVPHALQIACKAHTRRSAAWPQPPLRKMASITATWHILL